MTIPRLAPDCRALLRQGFIYVRTVVLPTTHPGYSSGQPSECLRRDLKSRGC